MSTPGVPLARNLAAHGDAVAVSVPGPCAGEPALALTYRDLAARVGAAADRLGPVRRLVLVAARNDLDTLVALLAALSAGHPVLLAPGGSPAAVDALDAAWDPDVVVRGGELQERRAGTAHDLHPDLALLLSTSGSTGSPRLVRLSAGNVQSNAAAIATYLGIRGDDVAPTALPVSYCYGLSVVTSHLLAGAGLLLTGRSVVDPRFWADFRRHGATSLAGVPHTFDLLARSGFADLDLPRLRYVTQAGGRLAPERVRSFAELGRRRGWNLVVMYGATEATARMAYLPPDLAIEAPHAIGVPVPGGTLSLRPVDAAPAPDVGELVYTGPNVMLGYADVPADLALGRVLHELATGDLARRTAGGLFEVVGRRSRFLKVHGVRVDLDRCEEVLAEHGLQAACAGRDGALGVAVVTAGAASGDGGAGDAGAGAAARRVVVERLGVPGVAVRVAEVAALPRLENGKPDLVAVARLTGTAVVPAPPPRRGTVLTRFLRSLRGTPPGHDRDDRTAEGAAGLEVAVVQAVAEVVERPDATAEDTFTGLGGDSLSYVAASVALERLLGDLPVDWPEVPLGWLAARAGAPAAPPAGTTAPPAPGRARSPRRGLRRLETGVALRAVAIVLIVATHASLVDVRGTAHVLVAVAGYNFARFRLTAVPRGARVRGSLRSIARVALPSVAWIAVALWLTDRYAWPNVLLLNAVIGPPRWTPAWDFWFVEVLVLVLLAMTALTALPWVDRAERRWPFAVPAAVVAAGLLWRFDLVGADLLHTKPVLWLFGLGWAAARARTPGHRVAVSVLTLLAVPGFFDDPRRDALIAGGVLLLTWAGRVPWPRSLLRPAGVLASASLFVYLTHWQVYPHLVGVHPGVAVAASLAVGVGYWWAWSRVSATTARRWAAARATRAPEARARPAPPATSGPAVPSTAKVRGPSRALRPAPAQVAARR